MIAILSLLIILTLSLILTRIAALALSITGLSSETAQFQARSAFTGVGFTTSESENILNHPVRRRIIMMLMLAGNLGVATIIATGVLTYFSTSSSNYWWVNLATLALGLILLYKAATNQRIERWLNKIIAWGLRKWTHLNVKDTVTILQLENAFAVSELLVDQGDWLAGKSLREAALAAEGVLILGIHHENGVYRGAPRADETIEAGDTLVLYAKQKRVQELDQRIRGFHGEIAHREAIEEFEVSREQDASLKKP
ncbi:MAG: TrkA C-terminal domain-containing protein [Candidatus Marinimicrobia bacterium]|nr:TrkA C-terminal domain-containing protein [Candidatus Neomarinimicrobiota bacterium]MCF7922148.1 TrkA C-terminal domain-containing protein [Candidatus Neomarinimicrobiota bacterium]